MAYSMPIVKIPKRLTMISGEGYRMNLPVDVTCELCWESFEVDEALDDEALMVDMTILVTLLMAHLSFSCAKTATL
jgi:hypothetical protein